MGSQQSALRFSVKLEPKAHPGTGYSLTSTIFFSESKSHTLVEIPGTGLKLMLIILFTFDIKIEGHGICNIRGWLAAYALPP